MKLAFYKKMRLATVMLLTSTFFSVSLAMAADIGVAGGKHDFSNAGGSGTYHDPDVTATQVCVYCHTPHNAGQTRLLWNKDNKSNTTFKLYTSSSTLTNVVKNQSTLPAGSPSLFCLSCHDGKTAINVMHSGGKGADASALGYPAGSRFAFGSSEILMPGTFWIFTDQTPSMAIGQRGDEITGAGAGDDLTDDHPIGFSYSDVLSENSAGLKNLAAAQASGIRFFTAKDRVECSSCHNPHANYEGPSGNPALRPFLVRSNAQSGLCLSCHDK